MCNLCILEGVGGGPEDGEFRSIIVLNGANFYTFLSHFNWFLSTCISSFSFNPHFPLKFQVDLKLQYEAVRLLGPGSGRSEVLAIFEVSKLIPYLFDDLYYIDHF